MRASRTAIFASILVTEQSRLQLDLNSNVSAIGRHPTSDVAHVSRQLRGHLIQWTESHDARSQLLLSLLPLATGHDIGTAHFKEFIIPI